MKTRFSNYRGFTRIELLAVLTTVLLFTMAVFPSRANNRGHSRATLCLSNQRELVLAWQLYATAEDGFLVENYHGGEASRGAAANNPRNAPWACGWITWGTEPDSTNINFLRVTKFARMAPYLSSDRNVHKCPSDDYIARGQKEAGFAERSRTVSMNSTLGAGNARSGPWDPLYRQAFKLSDLVLPSPAETTVFLDEHPDSMNDPLFWAPAAKWIETPANLHKGGGSFSFADGHVTLHQWQTSTMRSLRVRYSSYSAPVGPAGDPDITWMSYRSQRAGDETY